MVPYTQFKQIFTAVDSNGEYTTTTISSDPEAMKEYEIQRLKADVRFWRIMAWLNWLVGIACFYWIN